MCLEEGGALKIPMSRRGANELPEGRKDLLSGQEGVGGTIQINYEMNFIKDDFQRFFSQHFQSCTHGLLREVYIRYNTKNECF